jgi:hypothetical protein
MSGGDAGRVVAELGARFGAIGQAWHDGCISQRRKPVGDIADVIVQAEELVQDNKLAARRSVRGDPIGRQHMTIAGSEHDILFHHLLHRFMMAPNRGFTP